MAVLVVRAFPIVWTHHIQPLICRRLCTLRHDDRTTFRHRTALHYGLHLASMLTLDAKTGHGRPLLMIKVNLLLSII